MSKEHMAQLLESIVGKENIKVDEPMSLHTSFKIGGPADLLVTPDSLENVGKLVEACRSEGIPFLIMGNGSNLLVRDKGIRGVVIKIFDNLNGFSVQEDIITAEAGILLSKIANVALKHELAGLEFASGIPGTLGGAVTMNAGAYGGEMKDVVIRTEYIDQNGSLKVLEGEAHRFEYRKSIIQEEGGIVLSAVLKLQKGVKTREEIKAKMDELNKSRKDKQPLEMPSAGSVFRRPEGHFVGPLIEQCNLKGYRIGGAEVSTKHCGFIVNAGNATAENVITLIKHIQAEVKGRFGVDLHTEVKVVGDE